MSQCIHYESYNSSASRECDPERYGVVQFNEERKALDIEEKPARSPTSQHVDVLARQAIFVGCQLINAFMPPQTAPSPPSRSVNAP